MTDVVTDFMMEHTMTRVGSSFSLRIGSIKMAIFSHVNTRNRETQAQGEWRLGMVTGS